jgi:hypothetical protein
MNVYGIIVHDWSPSQAVMTALILWGASATTPQSQLLHCIDPGVKPTSRRQREDRL